MPTARRAPVASTTKPSISDPMSNRPVGGDMTPGVGSRRKGKQFAHGDTPGSRAVDPATNWHSAALVDTSTSRDTPASRPAPARFGK